MGLHHAQQFNGTGHTSGYTLPTINEWAYTMPNNSMALAIQAGTLYQPYTMPNMAHAAIHGLTQPLLGLTPCRKQLIGTPGHICG